MSRNRKMRCYVLEGLVTVVAVIVITVVMLNWQGTDPVELREALLPPDVMEAEESRVADGTWRDEFDRTDNWIVWAGDVRTSQEGRLVLQDADGEGAIALQKRPLRFGAAEIEVRVTSEGGVFSLGVAESGEGPLTELAGAKDCCLPITGIALDLGFGSTGDESGRLRWMSDGKEMLSVVTQDRPLPAGEWANVNVSLGPQRCAVALNGREAGEVGIPWPEGGYRIYLGTSGAEARVDYLALTVPRTTDGTALGSIGPGERIRGSGPGGLAAGSGAALRAISTVILRSLRMDL